MTRKALMDNNMHALASMTIALGDAGAYDVPARAGETRSLRKLDLRRGRRTGRAKTAVT
jgi:hypothetical protein